MIWVVSEFVQEKSGPDVTLLRAFMTADEAKAYIATLPAVKGNASYDWESVELEDNDNQRVNHGA